MRKRKIAITTTSFFQYDKETADLLKRKGFEVILNPYGRKLKKEEILEICKGAVGIIAGTESLDEEVLNNLSDIRVISRCGVGLDNIDMQAARKLRMKVYNTPDAPTLAVAELTIGLMINLLRKINLMDGEIRDGKWKKEIGNLLHRKSIGIIGFGRIGRKVAELLQSFECKIKYTDPSLEDCISGFEKATLERLLSWADIVSIHASCAEKIIGPKEFGFMKKGSYLLNLSRGEAVDLEALYQALKLNYLGGAALDVFEGEPYNGPLKELNNVILTPHIGSYAIEARRKMELQALKNLIRGLEEDK